MSLRGASGSYRVPAAAARHGGRPKGRRTPALRAALPLPGRPAAGVPRALASLQGPIDARLGGRGSGHRSVPPRATGEVVSAAATGEASAADEAAAGASDSDAAVNIIQNFFAWLAQCGFRAWKLSVR